MIQFFTLMIMLLVAVPAFAADSYAKITIGIYKDKTCPEKAVWDKLEANGSQKCVNYSYVDSKGVTTRGSNGNFRCYADKVVYDKYPFEENCNPKAKLLDKNHAVPVGVCLEAPSHEGPVYEKLLDYTYPGHENCRK
jgi:hypothetical protein